MTEHSKKNEEDIKLTLTRGIFNVTITKTQYDEFKESGIDWVEKMCPILLNLTDLDLTEPLESK